MSKYHYILEDANKNQLKINTPQEVCEITGVKQFHIPICIRNEKVVNGYKISKHENEKKPRLNTHLKRGVKLIHQKNGKEVTFNSRLETAQHLGITPGHLYVMLSTGKLCQGFKALDLAAHHKKRPMNKRSKNVLVIDPNGEKMVFTSRGKAGIFLGSSGAKVSAAIKNGWKIKGYEVNDA